MERCQKHCAVRNPFLASWTALADRRYDGSGWDDLVEEQRLVHVDYRRKWQEFGAVLGPVEYTGPSDKFWGRVGEWYSPILSGCGCGG